MLVMKCCCKRRCFGQSSTSEQQQQNTPIFVIPISVNDNNFDEGSLSSVSTFAPPSYDSLIPVIPPPPYSERKISGPDEAPPAYAEIAEQPTFPNILPPQTQQASRTINTNAQ
ncbi:hypothetical protein QTP70_019418 [Hemibagrus guttatus]|uniref:Uncharacterized protein n=1 Tax=Hemibagrus guttatus TaxID=175788 RepID=A0AAE0V1P8_9TELE|nr:hypothetical protein QTP70_019418 [Hemibagrus guttatus]